jgi:hypothetical protein
MRKGPLTGRAVLLAVAILCATTAAHAATTIATTDVTIVGNTMTAPVMLTRDGTGVPVSIRITANDGSIPTDGCDGIRNVATSAQTYTVGAAAVTSSGPTVSATFACNQNFATSPQANTLAVTIAASADVPLGNSSVPIAVGPAGSGSPLVALGDQLAPVAGFASPNLHIRVNPRPPSNVRSSVGNGLVRLNWDPSPDADVTHYVVSRGSGLFQTTMVVPASQLTFTDTGLTNGSTYCYRVRARYEDAARRRFQSTETAPFCVVPVPYTLEGFFDPVGATANYAANAGRAIPLKWRLLEGSTPIVDLVIGPGHWSLSSTEVSCATGQSSATATAESSGSSGLQYDLEAGHYVFVWKTQKVWTGTCRRFSATYAGQTLSANFSFEE